MKNMVIDFISLLLTKAALQIKCVSNSLTRNKFFNCPELLFLKGKEGAFARFCYLVFYNTGPAANDIIVLLFATGTAEI
jgi:hypothetical protein